MEPYRDPALPVGERVADLLARLTLEEKAGQLTQYFYLGSLDDPSEADLEGLPPERRAFAQLSRVVEQAIAAGRAGSALFAKDPETTNRLQRIAVEDSPRGIPLLFGFDVVHGLRTIFPVPIGLVATWSTGTLEAAQTVAARESRAVGIRWTFAPMIDIARDPRWGRIIEGVGEDPFLASEMAAAQVRGFQGGDGRSGILAGPKHFAGYGASRGGRDYEDVEISDSELWNVYLPPFRAAVEAGAGNVMSAYMDLNGVPASGNRWLLTEVLRDEFGFTGFVVSDANAIRSLEVQHFAEDLTDAGARAVSAGLDMEMCMFDPAFGRLPQAVERGLVSLEQIDRAVTRVLKVKFESGLFEDPFVEEGVAATVLGAPAHGDLAQRAAAESFVLLKNDGLLPLDPRRLGSVAVIGQLAVSQRDTLGPWVFDHITSDTVSVVDGLRRRLGGGVKVEHTPGVGIPDRVFPSPFDRMDETVAGTPPDWDDDAEMARAVDSAQKADVVIAVVGQRQNQIGEMASVSTLELPGRQLEQLQQISRTDTPLIVIVMSGRPLDLQWADANASAILHVWYPGTRGGSAVAEALLGDVSPAGRLPFTWPRHVGQVPMIYSHNRTFSPEAQEARYQNEPSSPLYPFGYGLSYATFEYANLRFDRGSIAIGESVSVSVDVTNTSSRSADEVAQLYVHQRFGTSSRPVRELKGFIRSTFAAGETQTLKFRLGPRELSYWSSAVRGYVQDVSSFDVWVGGDSTASLAGAFSVTE